MLFCCFQALASNLENLYQHKTLQYIFTSVSRDVAEHKNELTYQGTTQDHMQVPQVSSTLVHDLYFTDDPIRPEKEKVKQLERELSSQRRQNNDNMQKIKEITAAKLQADSKLQDLVLDLRKNIEMQKEILERHGASRGDMVCITTTLLDQFGSLFH